MNIRGALKRATEIFGKNARVEKKPCALWDKVNSKGFRPCSGLGGHPQPCPGGVMDFKVGRIQLGMFFSIEGSGRTWEEAFANVEWRQHTSVCRKRLFDKPCKTCDKLKAKVDGFSVQAVTP